MKTFLEQLNDFTAEHTTMPLKQFFLYITGGLWVMLIAIALFAPLSLSKLAALLLLYIISMITALLSYINFFFERIETLKNPYETVSDDNIKTVSEIQNQDHSFIVGGDK